MGSRASRLAASFVVVALLASGVWQGVGVAAAAPARPATHVVQEGETLSGIAADAGTDVATLLQLNGLDDADQLLVGQQLKLPQPASAPSAAAVGGATQARTHVVQDGDTLAQVAAAAG